MNKPQFADDAAGREQLRDLLSRWHTGHSMRELVTAFWHRYASPRAMTDGYRAMREDHPLG